MSLSMCISGLLRRKVRHDVGHFGKVFFVAVGRFQGDNCREQTSKAVRVISRGA